MPLLIASLGLLSEIVLTSLPGRWATGLFAGPRRDRAVVYESFPARAVPFPRAVGSVAPAPLRERRLAPATFVPLDGLNLACLLDERGLAQAAEPAYRQVVMLNRGLDRARHGIGPSVVRKGAARPPLAGLRAVRGGPVPARNGLAGLESRPRACGAACGGSRPGRPGLRQQGETSEWR